MRKRGILTFAAVLSFGVVTLFGSGVAHAAGGTATWTDATGDHKFSTAGNWAENAVPDAGDKLVFNTMPSSVPNPYNIVNDVTTAFSSVETTGSPLASYTTITLQNDLNLATNATWNIDTAKQLGVYMASGKKVLAAGNVSLVKGYLPSSLSMNGGVLVAKDGTILTGYNLSTFGAGSVVIEGGASLTCFGDSVNLTMPITLGGGTSVNPPEIVYSGCAGVAGGADPADTLTLNKVTLASNALIGVYGNDTVKIVDLVKNGHTLTLKAQADGTLVTPDGTQSTTYPVKTTQLDGDKPTENLTVFPNETAVLNGARCDVYVRAGGTLKGNGTLCSLSVYGKVSPGNSPGTITMTGMLALASDATYEVEVASKDSYDKLVAKDVYIDNTTLDLKYLAGAKVAAGDAYTIISNTGTGPVNGTFKDLPEGATFNAQGGTFKISYVGGDGNDVTITVVSVPNVPNTGFEMLKANPGLIALGALLAAGAVAFVARQSQKARR